MGKVALVILCEVLFGLVFNRLTAISEARGFIDGYTSLYVAVGVAATVLIAQPLLGWSTVCMLTLVFAGSGAPMMAGHMARHMRARRAEQERLLQELKR